MIKRKRKIKKSPHKDKVTQNQPRTQNDYLQTQKRPQMNKIRNKIQLRPDIITEIHNTTTKI